MTEIKKHEFIIIIENVEEGLMTVSIDGIPWTLRLPVHESKSVERNGAVLAYERAEALEPYKAAVQELFSEMYGMLGKAVAIVEEATGIKQD